MKCNSWSYSVFAYSGDGKTLGSFREVPFSELEFCIAFLMEQYDLCGIEIVPSRFIDS